MRIRVGHGALLLFQALWLNVVLPGHTRGVIVLPGSSDGVASACCTRDSGTGRDGPKHEPADRVASCAICAFSARLTVPPVIDLQLGRLQWLANIDVARAGDVVSLDFLPTYLGCGPPAAA